MDSPERYRTFPFSIENSSTFYSAFLHLWERKSMSFPGAICSKFTDYELRDIKERLIEWGILQRN